MGCGRDVLPAGRADAEALADDREQRRDLHRADSREGEQAPLQVLAAFGLEPDALGPTAVVLGDDGAEFLNAPRHVAREAVDRRLLPEDLLEGGGVGCGDRRGVEAAEPAPDLERAGEGLLHRNLLVEDEPDEQGQRLGEEAVGLVVAREVEGAWGGWSPCPRF